MYKKHPYYLIDCVPSFFETPPCLNRESYEAEVLTNVCLVRRGGFPKSINLLKKCLIFTAMKIGFANRCIFLVAPHIVSLSLSCVILQYFILPTRNYHVSEKEFKTDPTKPGRFFKQSYKKWFNYVIESSSSSKLF